MRPHASPQALSDCASIRFGIIWKNEHKFWPFYKSNRSALADYLQASVMLQYNKRLAISEHIKHDTNIVHFHTLSHRF